MEIVPAYRGLIYVDADLLTVTRITLEAIDIPPTFPIQLAKTTLDYDFIKIGDAEHVLPLRAEVRMREGRTLVKNDVEFRMYRKFGAEATIKFETPEPLPEDATKEQPVQGAPSKPPNE
jgi:N12 class adenine-specific DNA methylase